MTKKYDAQRHAALRQELQAMEEARAQQFVPLVEALKAAVPQDGFDPHSDLWADLAEHFAGHAEALRDALAPFDSGVRPAAQAQGGA